MLYLDNAATMKVSSRVAGRVSEVLQEDFGNPSSKHGMGNRSRKLIDEVRVLVASAINAKPDNIVFTSGGTESNNLAIRGLASSFPDKKHIITSSFEHASVLEVCKFLEKQGYRVDYVKPDSEGFIDPKIVESLITSDTLLVSVMHANNEVGTVQPIEEIGNVCKEKKVFFHIDAVQSFCKLPLDWSKCNASLITLSSHKVGGPKGVGALFVKSGLKLQPLQIGGGQENSIRNGTQNVSGIVGFGEALSEKMPVDSIASSRDKLLDRLLEIPGSRLNGSRDNRLCNNINISFFGIQGEALMLRLSDDSIFVSTGSACASSKVGVSHVLEAIGCDKDYIQGSIRISLMPLSDDEINFVFDRVSFHVSKLRELSPFKLNMEVSV